MSRRVPARAGAAAAHARRAAGQAAAVAEMINAGRPFEAVVQQLLATRGSLDSLLVRLAELELAGNEPIAFERSADVSRVLHTAFDRAHRMPDPSPGARSPSKRMERTLP